MEKIKFDVNKPIDIIFLGRITIDLNPAYSSKVRETFKPLEDVHYFEKFVGGSPANTAIGVAKHGMKVGFIGKISNDSFGNYVMDYFKRSKIDTQYITRCRNGEKMGLTFTEMLSSEESRILMYRNGVADLQLHVDDISEEYIGSAKAIFISGTALAESPSREATLKAVLLAKKNGTKIIFDIDYRNYNWKNSDEISIYCTIVAKEADLIIGSREEFDFMETLLGAQKTDLDSAEYWHKYQAKILVIKHGLEGSMAYIQGGAQYKVKPFPVQARKSFGGGDGYNAGFLYGLFQEWDIIDCLEFGSAEASMMVKSNNCSNDLPNTEEVKAFIKQEKKLYGEFVSNNR